jgi:hypothetical protein
MPPLPRVRVLPKDDDTRLYLRHPSGNIGFPESGSVEWPLDRFTHRRIADGDVTIEGGGSGARSSEHPGPQSHRRSAS